MTDEGFPDPIRRALDRHDAFVPVDDGEAYDLETTPLSVRVTADPAEGKRDGRVRVVVEVPTLDAVVTGETVADVVEDGWFETLERRLADAFDVAHTSTHEDPVVDRDDRTVRVDLVYTAWSAGEGVEDAKALAEFVEGTFVQGVVPGYDYREPVTDLLSAARQGEGGSEGGTPL